MQLLTRHRIFDFGAQLVDDLRVIGVQRAVNHDNRVRIGLPEQVLRFVNLVRSVHGYQHGTNLRCRPECDVPRRNICCPNGHFATRLHAHAHQSTREVIHVLAEFFVGTRVVKRGVLEGILVGELFHNAIKHLRERQIYQVIFRPHELTGAVMVPLQRAAFRALRAGEAVHIVHEMRQNDFRLGHVFHPFGHPFQRNEAVVVNGRKRQHHFIQRQNTLAHQRGAVVGFGVHQVHVLHIRAQIADSDGGLLLELPIRVAHRPQRTQVIACIRVHEFAQTRRIGINARCLDEHGHLLFFGVRHNGGKRGTRGFFVAGNSSYAHARCEHFACNVDERRELFRVILAVGNVNRRVQHRNLQVFFAQLTRRCMRVVNMEGRTLAHQFFVFGDIEHFNAVEIHFFGQANQFVPRTLRPALCGKRQFH